MVFLVKVHGDDCCKALRIPQFITEATFERMESEIATLQFVGQLGLPVPKLLYYSLKFENALGCPYMVQEAVKGATAVSS